MTKIFAALLAAFIAIVPLGAAMAQPQPVATPAQQRPYVLGAGDIIEVEVLGQTDFGKPRVRVKPDGTVPLPLIGNVRAANLTTSDLALTIERQLAAADVYTRPAVNVEVVAYASRYVIVLGEVAQPGLLPVDRPYRVSEILARAGGLRDGGADYVVLSGTNGVERRLPVAELARAGSAYDPFVSPDDKLFVPKAELFYIYGQVNAPGAYPLKSGMTLRQALARGGGLTASGSEKKLTLYRQGAKVARTLDTPIQAGDVVAVGERFF